MTRKSFAGLAALLGLGTAKMAMDSRGTSSGLGRGWTQVSASRAVLDEYGRWTPDRIRQANAINGVGSSKRRKAVRGF